MRIVMLTPDIAIDRRIILEAKTLIAVGHEVILLAGWEEGYLEYELIDGIKVRRIRYDGLDPRLRWLVVLQGSVIGRINACSSISMVLWNSVSRGANKAIGAAARATYLFWNLLARVVTNAAINLALRGTGWAWNLVARGANKVIGAAARATYLFWVCLARCVNWGVILFSKGLPWLSGITGYELTLARVARYYDADVYHAHDLPMLRPVVIAASRGRAKIIYDAHELYPEIATLQSSQKRRLSRIESKYIRKADTVITVNEFIAEEMARRYRCAKPAVIYNTTTRPSGLSLEARPDLLREDLKISLKQRIVLYHGWMAPHRGLQHLVLAARSLRKDVTIVLMGYGEFRKELEALSNKYSIGDQVLFRDAVPQEMLLLYAASADAGIIPYQPIDLNNYYCSPNKLFDFIMAGVPLIVNDLPFLRKVVSSYEIGLVAPLDSPAACAHAIETFFEDAERLHHFRQNLLKMRESFSWEAEEAKLKAIYNSLGESPLEGAASNSRA
jgi:glycosyltransferase involved in cell wall biosynthesis